MKRKTLIQLMVLMLFGIGTMAQNSLDGTISKQYDREQMSPTPQQQQAVDAMESKEWEIIMSTRSGDDYQEDLWESFEQVGYPEFWTSTEEEWMFETYEGYDDVPIIDGERFLLLFGGWEESIDTLITPILDIQTGDDFSFYLGQWESPATGGDREPVDIMYGPTLNGPWTILEAIDVSGQDMWDLQNFVVDVSDAAGANFIAFACEGYFIMDLVEGPARYYYEDDLMSVSLSGISAPKANTPTDYDFIVKNVTNASVNGSDYTVKLMQEPGIELSSLSGVDLDIWDEHTFTFDITFPSPDVTEEIYAVIDLSSDANLANNESNHITVNVLSDEYDYYYIGDPETTWGNYYQPFQTQDDFNSYSEIIYWKDDLDYPAGEIIGLDYEFHYADDTEDVPVTIWMAEIDYDCFNHKHWGGPDLLTADKMYQVFDGIINVYEVDGHLYIPLDSGFTYTGEGNLVVLMRGLSNGPENEWIGWKATVVGQCDDYGSPAWTYHWYDVIDPNDISNYHWTFTGGNTVPNGSFVMNTELGGLTGTVQDDAGNAIEGAKIEVTGTNLYVYTDENGNYTLSSVLHGDHEIVASKYGYEENEQTASITTGNTTTLDLTMTSSGEINVTGNVVKAHDGNVIAGATATLTYVDYSINEMNGTSDDDGDFSVSVEQNFKYQLKISAIGYAAYEDVVTVNTSDVNLGTIELTESFSNVFNVVATSAVDSAIISWQLPDTEVKDTLVLDDDSGQGGMGYYNYTEGWTGNLFEIEGLHTITGVQFEINGPASDTCSDYISVDIFSPEGDLLHEGLPVYPVGYRWNTYMLENPVTIDGSFYVMMHSHETQATSSFLTRWDWDGEAENYTNVIHYYDPEWPENNGFIRVYEYNEFDGTGCLMIRPVMAVEDAAMSPRNGRSISGYNVYKGETSDINDVIDWEELNDAPVDTLVFIDSTWPPEDTVSMIFAVETLYAEGNSEYCFSTTVKLGMPEIISEPVLEAYSGLEYTYDVEAIETRNHAVSFSAEMIPDALTIIDNGDGTALLSGTFEEEGSYDVILVVTNGVYEDTQEFTIVVETTLIPIFVSTPDTLVGENQDYLYEIEVYYGGSGSVTIEEGEEFPDWLTLDDNGDQTATLYGNTDVIGEYAVELIATDGTYSSSQLFDISVAAIPEFISEPVTTIELDHNYVYEIEVSYNGEEACEILAQETLPSWLSLTDHGDNTATLEGIPTDIEAYTIELLAQGDYYSDVQIFTLDVSVGFGEFGQKEINVYPNPTRQKINIDNVEGAHIVVYNMVGEVIIEVNDAKQKELIDLGGNRNGIYFVRILNGTEVITRKINLVR